MTLSREPRLLLLLAFVLLLLLYLGGFPEALFLVDDFSLVDIPQIRAPLDLALLKTFFGWSSNIDYYPLRDLSYWVDVNAFGAIPNGGGGSVFRAQNFLWFLGCGLLLEAVLEEVGASRANASVSAAAWMLLPIHSETLMWVAARKDVLALFFCLAFALCALRVSRTRSWKLVAAGLVAFLFGQLSKASFTALPLALALGWALTDRARLRAALPLLAPAFALGVVFSLVQANFYSSVNDMRYFYETEYRVRGSIEALGRVAVGLVDWRRNTIDLENWGDWVRMNAGYFPVGILAWVGLGVASLAALWKRRGLEWVIGFWAVYLPVSSLLFPHRNFYSVRYFEIPIALLWVGAVAAVRAKSPLPGARRFRPAAIALALALLTGASFAESRHWQTVLDPFRKSAELAPANPALRRFLYDEYLRQARWGRLDASGLAEFEALAAELRARCGGEALSEPFRNGHLCLSFWADELTLPEAHPQIDLERAIALALEQVNPGRKRYFDDRIALRRSTRDSAAKAFDPGSVLANSGGTPGRRVEAIALLCLNGSGEIARRKWSDWRAAHLVDDRTRVEGLVDMGKMFPARRAELRDCFR